MKVTKTQYYQIAQKPKTNPRNQYQYQLQKPKIGPKTQKSKSEKTEFSKQKIRKKKTLQMTEEEFKKPNINTGPSKKGSTVDTLFSMYTPLCVGDPYKVRQGAVQ
jgi:hypothetical protein